MYVAVVQVLSEIVLNGNLTVYTSICRKTSIFVSLPNGVFSKILGYERSRL